MIVFTCGGSGGHVYPAIAIAQELNRPDILFIGSETREDAQIIPRYGFKFQSISSSSKNILKLFKGLLQSLRLLKQEKAHVVVGSGGYLTASVILAAFLLRIPIVLIEQNAKPGRVNRYLQCLAHKIFLSFSPSLTYFNEKKAMVVGNPVRKFFLQDTLVKEFQALTLPSIPSWLVFGGSQGAESLNELFLDQTLYFLKNPVLLIHLTGSKYFKNKPSDSPIELIKDENGIIKIIRMPYFEAMNLLYQKASLVISRSGATTVAELLYFSKPSILIPYPLAKDNHQVDNANIIVKKKNGILIHQKDLEFSKICESALVLESQKTEPDTNNAREIIAKYVAHY